MVRNPVIGVGPPVAFRSRQRLFTALATVFNVRFVDIEPTFHDAAATIWLSADDLPEHSAGMVLQLTQAPIGPRKPSPPTPIHLANTNLVDVRLRGQTLNDEHLDNIAVLQPRDTDVVLATSPQGPVWIARGTAGRRTYFQSVLAPDELNENDRLKDSLCAGRFFGLLPLLELLRNITDYHSWQRCGPRANFSVDDPNLRWSSYGYLDYIATEKAAAQQPFHLDIAMVPLDSLFTTERGREALRSSKHLSLVMHGNDHTKRELLISGAKAGTDPGGPACDTEALILGAQALRRVARFEQHNNLPRGPIPYGRIMVPPHGTCSTTMMQALGRLGYPGVTYNGPALGATPEQSRLSGWWPTDLHAGGLAHLHRMFIRTHPDEMVLRAYLDQLVTLYFHHTDLAREPDLLASTAQRVNQLLQPRWESMATTVHDCAEVRQVGDQLHVRMFGPTAQIFPPTGTRTLTVELPGPFADETEVWIGNLQTVQSVETMRQRVEPGVAVDLPKDGSTAVGITLRHARHIDSAHVPLPRPTPWPFARRVLTEGRDRAFPLLPFRRRPLGRPNTSN